MAERIAAEVHLPLFGYRVHYRDPIFDFEKLDNQAVSAAYAAFRPWNITLGDVTFKENPTNLGEEATNFNLLAGRLVFSLTAGGCSVLVTKPSWSDAELLRNIAAAGIEAVLKATGAEVEKQEASITMHVTPQAGTIQQITSRFVRIDTKQLPGETLRSFGFSVYKKDFLLVVDMSAAFPNALFLRLDRWFGTNVSLDQIANELNKTESAVMDLLGLEVD